ncbi:hypothetical protein [Candidatus Poriferisocius sp.]|uniref:hypothetical protein n=1 Tax=Candidatus Poriferisocius sp. TaxID=3101276 RepID=UPI003B5C714D
MYTRLLPAPEHSFFLFGVRGVGKSTSVKMALPDATRFDLLDEALFTDLLADPGLFGNLLREVEPGAWVVGVCEPSTDYPDCADESSSTTALESSPPRTAFTSGPSTTSTRL